MPVIKSAKKKLRQDKKRTIQRAKVEASMKEAIKQATEKPSEKALSTAFATVDKASKVYIVHANKAARIKSRLSHLLHPKASSTTKQPAAKSPSQKKSKVEKAKPTKATKSK